MKTLSAILLLLLLPVLGWAQAPIYRQFFTTNPAPVVDVVAGSNATVVASTPAVNIRRFTVSSTAVGLSNIVDAGYVAAARNLDVATNLTTLVTSYSNTPVASLVTPSAGQFPIRYASDVITTRGTGGFVRWDGSNWRTLENVVATTSKTNWLLNAYASASQISGPAGYFWNWYDQKMSSVNEIGLTVLASGTGASAGTWVAAPGPYGTGLGSRGTSSGNGHIGWYGSTHFPTHTIGVAVGNVVYVSSLPTAATIYAVAVGAQDGASTAKWPANGAFFACDTQQLFYNFAAISGTPTATWTNNWLAVCANSSTYTVYDTGLPISTSATAPNRLFVEMFWGASAVFFTNGIACLTNALNVPVANQVQIPSLYWTNSTAGAQYFISSAQIGYGLVRTNKTLP